MQLLLFAVVTVVFIFSTVAVITANNFVVAAIISIDFLIVVSVISIIFTTAVVASAVAARPTNNRRYL